MHLKHLLFFINLDMTLSILSEFMTLHSPFDSHLCLGHLQDLIESELAKMPSCNLAKSMHNKLNCSLPTMVVICILLQSMISFGHSCRLFGITNI